MQQGQVFELEKRAVGGSPVWAYRYRTGGPGSRRLQGGGFSRIDAFVAALTDSHGIPVEEAADVPITGTPAGRRAVRGLRRRRRDMARPHRDRRRLARPMGADRRSRHAARLTTDVARARADPLDQRAATRAPRCADARTDRARPRCSAGSEPRRRRSNGFTPGTLAQGRTWPALVRGCFGH
jgi:hypothetical protein